MSILNKIMNMFSGNNFKNKTTIIMNNMSNGPTTSKEFKFKGITSVVNDSIFDIVLNNNPSNLNDSCILDAPENQIDKIHLTEKNGTLFISSDNGSFGKVKISLVTCHLNKFINNSCGELDAIIVGKSLDFKNSGTGDVTLKANVGFIEISNTGVGNLSGHFDSNNVKIESSGTGDIELNGSADSVVIENSSVGEFTGNIVCQSLKFENSGTGDVNISGSAVSVEIENTSAGDANFHNLKAEKIDFHASGTGDLDIYATKEISGKSTGVGDVTYSGIKAVFIQNTGVGDVVYR